MLFLLTQTAHSAAASGGHEAGGDHGVPHISSWVQLLAKTFAPSAFSDFLVQWEKAIFSFVIVALIGIFAWTVSRNVKIVPGRAQMLLENLVLGLDGLVCGVLGPQGRKHTPFIGSLFIYIFVSNMFGLIPLQNSTMSFITTTAPIAIYVFFYVQWVGIRENGPKGYIYHLMGSPKDVIGWALVPLNMPLHILSEFIKPLSLSFRLYGNVMAGHILLGVFIMLGIQMLAPLHVPAGVPLHFPFLLLEIMVGLIQAFVFTLLTTVYVAMMLPHEHEHEHEPHAGHESGHAQVHDAAAHSIHG